MLTSCTLYGSIRPPSNPTLPNGAYAVKTRNNGEDVTAFVLVPASVRVVAVAVIAIVPLVAAAEPLAIVSSSSSPGSRKWT